MGNAKSRRFDILYGNPARVVVITALVSYAAQIAAALLGGALWRFAGAIYFHLKRNRGPTEIATFDSELFDGLLKRSRGSEIDIRDRAAARAAASRPFVT